MIVPWWPSSIYFGNLQVRLLIIQSRFLTSVVQAMLLQCWRIRCARDQLMDLASGELVSDNNNGNSKNFPLVACLFTGRLDREPELKSLRTSSSSSRPAGVGPLKNNMDPAGGGGHSTAEALEFRNIPLL